MKYWHPHLPLGQYNSVSTLVYWEKKRNAFQPIQNAFFSLLPSFPYFSNAIQTWLSQLYHFSLIPVYFLPHSCIFSPSFLYIFSLIPLYFLLHSCIFSPSFLYIFSLIPVYFLPHSCIFSPSFLYIFSLIPVYLLPHSCIFLYIFELVLVLNLHVIYER
jgi:hypothetical protein